MLHVAKLFRQGDRPLRNEEKLLFFSEGCVALHNQADSDASRRAIRPDLQFSFAARRWDDSLVSSPSQPGCTAAGTPPSETQAAWPREAGRRTRTQPRGGDELWAAVGVKKPSM